MNADSPSRNRVLELLSALADGWLEAERRQELLDLLRRDPEARAVYAEHAILHSLLFQKSRLADTATNDAGFGAASVGIAGLEASIVGVAEFGAETSEREAIAQPPTPAPPVINLSVPSKFAHSFAGGWAFSYTVATVFMCLLLLGFWAYKLPSDRGSSIASNENSRRSTTSGEEPIHDRSAPVFVGRVTGIAGAKWSDEPNYITPIGVRVALGRTYKLKSGLMEITYDSGAKVILEGPCDYKVDSTAGGYLALGKLVAKVGTGGEGRGTGDVASGQRSVANMKDESGRMKDEGGRPNADSLATRHSPLATTPSPLSPLPSPLFSVRTPTAVVTDLGTEFGVEVDERVKTLAHVFEGVVNIRLNSDRTNLFQTKTIRTGQTAICDNGEKINVDAKLPNHTHFVRHVGVDPARAERILESFDGNILDPALEQMPAGRFVNVSGAAEYRYPPNNEGRGYIRTCKTDFCDRDFVFDATINVSLKQPDPENVSRQIILGIGDGIPNAGFYDTVTCGLTFGYIIDSGLLQVVFRRPETGAGHEENDVISQLATGIEPGRHRIRMWKRGNWVGFDMDADFNGKFSADYSTRTINLKLSAPLLDETNSRLFIGTGNCKPGMIRFEDVTITFSENTKNLQAEKPDIPTEERRDDR